MLPTAYTRTRIYRHLLIALSITLTLFAQRLPTYAQDHLQLETVQFTPEEYKLYQLVMAYRKEKGLPEIPASASLTLTAQLHVWDLMHNQPDTGRCNMHSWSDKGMGRWFVCCYEDGSMQAKCSWDKPNEITHFPKYGYEITHYFSSPTTAEIALSGWKKSYGHNAVIINSGGWEDYEWKSIGIGILENYAVIWFSFVTDPHGPPAMPEGEK